MQNANPVQKQTCNHIPSIKNVNKGKMMQLKLKSQCPKIIKSSEHITNCESMC